MNDKHRNEMAVTCEEVLTGTGLHSGADGLMRLAQAGAVNGTITKMAEVSSSGAGHPTPGQHVSTEACAQQWLHSWAA